ncbi:MAG TPA: PEGA domain-containing protein, partial [Burkholderiales bacterium]
RSIALGTAALSVAAFAIAVVLNLLGHNSEVSALPSQTAEQRKTIAVARQENVVPAPNHKTAEGGSRRQLRRAQDAGLPASKSDAEEKVEKKEAKPSAFAFFSSVKSVPKAPAQPEPAGAALITLAIAPWGEVYVDGERIGVSPPVNEVEVAPGKRKIEIRNGSFPVYTQVLDVKADQKVRIKHKFN